MKRRANVCYVVAKKGQPKPAPFNKPTGEPFLEVHHVIGLAEGGPDIVENAVALCPNCHREAHHGEYAELIKEELGYEWLDPHLFRFGASSLLTDIERQLEHHVTGHYSADYRHPTG